MIGLGYYGTFTPPVILRNVMENPAWYTAYTPYQPEISQGRLEALLNFQTMVADLTGLPTSGASLLDEGTAAAEAMALSRRVGKVKDGVFLVDADALPQTIAVIGTRAEPTGVEVVVADLADGIPAEVAERGVVGVLLQYPGASGAVRDIRPVIEQAHELGAVVTVAADLLALTLLTSPGELGADIAVGTTQRFGVPMGFGGPHAGYMAVREKFARSLPGRLVGVSVDADGNKAYRLALQTREQHIRREKATSNICTAQVLLAVMAGMYAVYHGPDGLRASPGAPTATPTLLAEGLRRRRRRDRARRLLRHPHRPGAGPGRRGRGGRPRGWRQPAARRRRPRSASPATRPPTRAQLAAVLGRLRRRRPTSRRSTRPTADALPARPAARATTTSTHPVFHQHRSETAMLRYLRRLADRDYALDRGMIPLGSCTMKLNATTEMEPVTWPEFGALHPFAPAEQAAGLPHAHPRAGGAARRGHRLRQGVAPAQRRLAGRAGRAARRPRLPPRQRRRPAHRLPHPVLRARHQRRERRDGRHEGRRREDRATTARSTSTDLRAKIEQHRDELAVLMITYPSTHGVFEEHVTDICAAGARRGRPGLRRRRQPQRPGGPRQAGPVRRRRLAPEPAQDVLHPARRRRPRRRPGRASARTSRRTCPTTRCSPPRAPRPVSARSPPRPGAPRASCRSPGRTCG